MASEMRTMEKIDNTKQKKEKKPITRVRTGCYTCRHRKKRCDERKPYCLNCEKTGVICEGYPDLVFWEARQKADRRKRIRGRSGSESTVLQSPREIEPGFGMGLQSYDNAIISQGYYEDQNHSNFGSETDFAYGGLYGAPSMELVANPQSQAGYGFENSPSSNNLVLLEANQGTQSMHINCFPSIYIPRALPYLIPGIDTPIQQEAFHHFTQVLSNLLTISTGNSNPINSVILPLACRDDTVMNTVLSLGTCHLVRLQREAASEELKLERDKLHLLACNEQDHRLHALKVAQRNESISSFQGTGLTLDKELMCATSLLLCVYEICEGASDEKWRRHLDAAKYVVDLCESPSSSPEANSSVESQSFEQQGPSIHPFLLEYYLYHSFLAAVTSNTPPAASELQRDALVDHPPTMVGVQDGLNIFVLRISALRVNAQNTLSPSGTISGDVIAAAALIWRDLDQWYPLAHLPSERQTIAYFYKEALFIWLYSIIHPDSKEDAVIQTMVQRISTEMCDIKFGPGVMSCLLFPLFVVGSAAVRRVDRERIEKHFNRLREWSLMGNLDVTLKVLEMLWDDHDRKVPRSWDWVRKLETMGINVLVT